MLTFARTQAHSSFLRCCIRRQHFPRGSAFTRPSSLVAASIESVRQICTTPLRLAQDKLPRDYNATAKVEGIWNRSLRIADLIEDFRELLAVSTLKEGANATEPCREYKAATRALIPLLDPAGDPDQVVNIESIRKVLPESNGRAWKVVRERVQHGEVSALSDIDEEDRILALFCRVNSVGQARARKFYEQGCRSLKDLETAKGVTYAQLMGLKLFEDFEALIPRSEVDEIVKIVGEAIKKVDSSNEFEVVGSYRRGEPWSSDVDLVVRHPGFDGTDELVSKALLARMVEGFKDIEALEKPLAAGPKRYHTMVRLPKGRFARRMDLRMVGWHDNPYMLLGSTGDLDLMKYLRQVAANKGWFLSEYGMGPRLTGEQRGMQKGADTFDPKRKIAIEAEEDIFTTLGLPYVPPTQRSYRYWSKILPRLPYRG